MLGVAAKGGLGSGKGGGGGGGGGWFRGERSWQDFDRTSEVWELPKCLWDLCEAVAGCVRGTHLIFVHFFIHFENMHRKFVWTGRFAGKRG